MSGEPRRSSQLHFLRHADAGDPEAWEGPDEARPLSPKGEQQSERLGRFLASVGFRPDAIITSPKLRSEQTARIVAGHLGIEVTADPRLAGAVDLAAVEAIVTDCGNPLIVVLVGHDPDFSEIVGALTGCADVAMRKGAHARIDAERPLSPGLGILRWLIPPDLLKAKRHNGA